MSHALECHVQLVLCYYTNLQLHVLHATEFLLQTTIVKPYISSNDIVQNARIIKVYRPCRMVLKGNLY